MDEVRQQIGSYVREMLEEQGHGEEVSDDTGLVSSGLLDSFAVIRLVVFMEKTFGIDFAEEYFDNRQFDSIAKMAEMVNELVPGKVSG